jgi:hypothetical protein
VKNRRLFREADRATRHLAEARALAPRPGLHGQWLPLDPDPANIDELRRRIKIVAEGADVALGLTEQARHLREIAKILDEDRDALAPESEAAHV